jgi:hypothetical protein
MGGRCLHSPVRAEGDGHQKNGYENHGGDAQHTTAPGRSGRRWLVNEPPLAECPAYGLPSHPTDIVVSMAARVKR